jgi:hypothetical protein
MQVLSTLNLTLVSGAKFLFFEGFARLMFPNFVVVKYEVNGQEYKFSDVVPETLSHPICVICEVPSMLYSSF